MNFTRMSRALTMASFLAGTSLAWGQGMTESHTAKKTGADHCFKNGKVTHAKSEDECKKAGGEWRTGKHAKAAKDKKHEDATTEPAHDEKAPSDTTINE